MFDDAETKLVCNHNLVDSLSSCKGMHFLPVFHWGPLVEEMGMQAGVMYIHTFKFLLAR